MTKSQRLVIVFAVMLVGGVLPTYLYTQRPETVVRAALKKLDGDVSFMAATTIGTFAPDSVVKAAGGDPKTMSLPLVFVGEGGMNLPKAGRPSGTAHLEMITGSAEGKELSLDTVMTGDGKSYARLTNLPSNPTSAALVSKLDGAWFSMDSHTLAALLMRDAASAGEDQPSGTRPAATLQTLRQDVSQDGFFGLPKQLGLATFTTVPIRHYSLPVNPEKATLFAQDLKSLLRGRSLTAQELEQVAKEMGNSKIDLEVWINAKTKEMAQLQLDISSVDSVPEDEDRRHVSVLLRFTSWGEPVEVTIPDQSQPYADIVTKAPAK